MNDLISRRRAIAGGSGGGDTGVLIHSLTPKATILPGDYWVDDVTLADPNIKPFSFVCNTGHASYILNEDAYGKYLVRGDSSIHSNFQFQNFTPQSWGAHWKIVIRVRLRTEGGYFMDFGSVTDTGSSNGFGISTEYRRIVFNMKLNGDNSAPPESYLDFSNDILNHVFDISIEVYSKDGRTGAIVSAVDLYTMETQTKDSGTYWPLWNTGIQPAWFGDMWFLNRSVAFYDMYSGLADWYSLKIYKYNI